MKLSAAEKAFVLRERHRIALDARDWNAEPFATHRQLREMSSWCAERLLASPVWQLDLSCDVLRNTGHPDNVDWANRHLLAEALRSCESNLGFYRPSLPSDRA